MFDFIQIILLVALGAFVGFTVGFTGIGGAVLMTPALILLLGFPVIVAIAIDIPYAASTKTLATYQHARQNNLRRDIAQYFIIGGLPGLTFGIIMLTVLEEFLEPKIIEEGLRVLLGTVLISVASIVLYQAYSSFKRENVLENRLLNRQLSQSFVVRAHALEESSATTPGEQISVIELEFSNKFLAIVLGAIIGVLVGLTSVGSGTLITVSLLVVFRLDGRYLVGTSLFIAWTMLVLGSILYFFSHWINDIGFYLPIILLLLLGSLPGAYFGSKLTNQVPDAFLKLSIGVIIWIAGFAIFL